MNIQLPTQLEASLFECLVSSMILANGGEAKETEIIREIGKEHAFLIRWMIKQLVSSQIIEETTQKTGMKGRPVNSYRITPHVLGKKVVLPIFQREKDFTVSIQNTVDFSNAMTEANKYGAFQGTMKNIVAYLCNINATV